MTLYSKRSDAMAAGFLAAMKVSVASSFVSSLGINTHIDFNAFGYQDLSRTAQAINYLGLKNLRDSGMKSTDTQSWLYVANATGAKFDDFMPEGSPADLQNALGLAPMLAAEGVLNYLEGGNEEDDPYASGRGNSLTWTAQFQQQVYQVGHSLGLPVINMSFGSGWTASNNWQGNYGAVGDLSAYADYANAHTYPLPGKTPDWTTQHLNRLAALAAKTRPIMITEFGWNEGRGFGQQEIAKALLNAALDSWKDGNAKIYFYALYDDKAGRFGLMNQDGTPKPAGTALHNLVAILTDHDPDPTNFQPKQLNYTLSAMTADDNSLLFGKADGSFWLSLWNEQQTPGTTHTVTLELPLSTARITIYDPLQGPTGQRDQTHTSSIQISVPDHPVLVEIIPDTSP
ncbi:MAG: hypothetical protein EPO08_11940 [Rhodospirillaceae bacterium]|nr:MAG: hypothetical protein EPO08_11940 [Rhodospirillaceae bacterium]